MNRNPTHFQVGNVPGDGDVFSSGGVTLPSGRPAIETPAGFPASFPSYPTDRPYPPNQPGAAIDRPCSPQSARRDRVGNVDAQAYYPATACVFVAK